MCAKNRLVFSAAAVAIALLQALHLRAATAVVVDRRHVLGSRCLPSLNPMEVSMLLYGLQCQAIFRAILTQPGHAVRPTETTKLDLPTLSIVTCFSVVWQRYRAPLLGGDCVTNSANLSCSAQWRYVSFQIALPHIFDISHRLWASNGQQLLCSEV